MSADQNLEAFSEIVERNGRAIMDRAVNQIVESTYDAGLVSSAVKYHVKFLNHVLPLVPALMTLSCEAVGGKKEAPIGVGAALTLLVEAANIHDDIIDQTLVKHKRKTTFGKYGQNVTVLAGDFLLFQASQMLSKECNALPVSQSKTILDLTSESLAKISKSAAKEAQMQKRFDVLPQDYLEIVKLRASVPQVHCMVGAILGGATDTMVSALGSFGENYGVVGTIFDEFMDLFDYDKFNARLIKECLPLPLMYVLKDKALKNNLLHIIEDSKVDQIGHANVIQLAMASEKVKELVGKQIIIVDKTIDLVQDSIKNNAGDDLSKLLIALRGLICNMDEFTNRKIE
jgi:geranylgeranyl pyrophosphate synthase